MIATRWMYALVVSGTRNVTLHVRGARLRVLAILFAFSMANTISGRSTLQRGSLVVANTTQIVQYVALVAGGFDTAKETLCGLCGETRISVAEKGVCAKCKRTKELRKKCEDGIKSYEEKWKAEYERILSKEGRLEEKYKSLKKRRESLEGPKMECGDNLGESDEALNKNDANSDSGKEKSQNLANEGYESELWREWKDKWNNVYWNKAKMHAKKAELSVAGRSAGRKSCKGDLKGMWNDMEEMVIKRCYCKHVKKHERMMKNLLTNHGAICEGGGDLNLYDHLHDVGLALWNGPIFAVMCEELDEDSLRKISESEKEMEEIGKSEIMRKDWETKVEKNEEELIAMCQEMYRMQCRLKRKYEGLKKETREKAERRKAELKKKREEAKMKYERDLKVMRDVKRRNDEEQAKKCDELKRDLKSEERKCEKEMEESENGARRELKDLERKHKEEDAKHKSEIVKDFLGELKRMRDELRRKYEKEVRKCEKEMEKCENEKQKMLRGLKSAKEKMRRKCESDVEKGEGVSLLCSLRDAILN